MTYDRVETPSAAGSRTRCLSILRECVRRSLSACRTTATIDSPVDERGPADPEPAGRRRPLPVRDRSFRFQGRGWYETDFKKDNQR